MTRNHGNYPPLPPLNVDEIKQRLANRSDADRAARAVHVDRFLLGRDALLSAREHLARGDLAAARQWLSVAARYDMTGARELLENVDTLSEVLGTPEIEAAATHIPLTPRSTTTDDNDIDEEVAETANVFRRAQDNATVLVRSAHVEADHILDEAQKKADLILASETTQSDNWHSSVVDGKQVSSNVHLPQRGYHSKQSQEIRATVTVVQQDSETPHNDDSGQKTFELVSDLKALRKGRGLYVDNVGDRIGNSLRDLCGVTDQDGPTEIRVRVAQRLEHLATDLPDDLRMAALAAFGMMPAARHPLYQERVSWIAQRIGRDPRTARRRIDEAIHQLAQLAAIPMRWRDMPVTSTTGWHTTTSRVFLMLEGSAAEAVEHHRIIAAEDDLREVELATVFGQPAVLSGGTLHDGTLALPAPLMAGESHDFWVRSRNPVRPRQLLYVPRRRCDHLELRVRFDQERPPQAVSRLQGRPPRDRGTVAIDREGEVQLIFRDLTRGSAYGLRWL